MVLVVILTLETGLKQSNSTNMKVLERQKRFILNQIDNVLRVNVKSLFLSWLSIDHYLTNYRPITLPDIRSRQLLIAEFILLSL
jgi:hypothetical protein